MVIGPDVVTPSYMNDYDMYNMSWVCLQNDWA